MPSKTKIEWADYVTNPVRAKKYSPHPGLPPNTESANLGEGAKQGFVCVKISEGCAHCWASSMNVRLGTGLEYSLPNLARVSTFINRKELEAIRTFRPKGPFKNGRDRALVFPCDMTDLFGEWMSDSDIGAVFNALASREDVDFLILTKRPGKAATWLNAWRNLNGGVVRNVMIGCSVENDRRAQERMPFMRFIARMGFRTVASYEPALDVVDWNGWEFLDGMICGGESGNQARPMPPIAARISLAFCQSHDIPFFFKQRGEWMPVSDALAKGWTTYKNRPVEMYGEMVVKVGKGLAGHVLEGREWRQMPNG